MTPTDAVYGFAAWLTCREGTLEVGATHDAAPVGELLEQWCTANHLPNVSGDYPGNLVQPA